nr:gliding motility lipoprotein GldB [Bacteroidota bacterium]
ELLYASDSETIRKLFTDGPFTHSFSSESPARIGEWIGWQIIRAYMNNNPDVTLNAMFEEVDAQKILEESGYRPKR